MLFRSPRRCATPHLSLALDPAELGRLLGKLHDDPTLSQETKTAPPGIADWAQVLQLVGRHLLGSRARDCLLSPVAAQPPWIGFKHIGLAICGDCSDEIVENDQPLDSPRRQDRPPKPSTPDTTAGVSLDLFLTRF